MSSTTGSVLRSASKGKALCWHSIQGVREKLLSSGDFRSLDSSAKKELDGDFGRTAQAMISLAIQQYDEGESASAFYPLLSEEAHGNWHSSFGRRGHAV